MARLLTAGAEWADLTAENVTAGGAAGTSTTQVRTGARAFRCGTSGDSLGFLFTGTTATSYFVRAGYFLDAFPTSGLTTTLVSWLVGGVTRGSVTVDDAGNISLWSSGSGSTLIASGGPVSLNSWFVLEAAIQINTGTTDDYLEARLNGVSLGSTTTVSIGTTGPTRVTFASASNGGLMYADDVAVNDSTGASQASWPGITKIALLRPISLNTNGGSWTDDAAATTSAALTAALDNAPPKGIADTTAGGGDHQVRNAGANSSLDMNLATYATAGIGALDTINVVEPQINVGAPVATAAKSGSFGITTNPTIANRVFTGGTGTAAFFWRGSAPGTYPTNWTTGWERGTVTYAPAVTVGSSPVARVTITAGTTTRIAMVDAMGLYVDYTPASVYVPRSPGVNFQDPGVFMKALRPVVRRVRDRIFVPELWLPGMPV